MSPRWSPAAVVFNDVIFNQRVFRPSINCQIAIVSAIKTTGKGYVLTPAGCPAFARGKVIDVAPGCAVVAASAQCHGDRTAAVRPERVVIAVIGAG